MLRYRWHLTRFLGQPEGFSDGSHTLEAIIVEVGDAPAARTLLGGADKLVGQGIYPSRSAAMRFALLDMLKRELWQQERETVKEEVVTTRKGRCPPQPSAETATRSTKPDGGTKRITRDFLLYNFVWLYGVGVGWPLGGGTQLSWSWLSC